MEWSDLRIFLAIAREGTLGAAARKLGQTQPTMGRRLKALEQSLGQVLFQRTSDGFVPTDEGAAMLAHAERIEEETFALERRLGGRDRKLDGMLRLSSSDWFGAVLLTPVLAAFAKLQPNVVVELLADARPFSLARREADLVFRIVPFDEPDVVARRLMHLGYAAYLKKGMPRPKPRDGKGCALVLMDTGFGGMPDVGWIRKLLPNAHIAFRSNSRDVQARLCALGVGLAVLPCPLGDATPGITRVDLGEPPPGRTVWLGYHRDMKRLARLRALLDLVIERLGD